MRTLRSSLSPLVLVTAAGCASLPSTGPGDGLDDVQARLNRLGGTGPASYSFAKAQCWLETARTQSSENDRTGYVEGALAEAARITQALEADKASKAGYETPLVAASERVREDLWAQLAGFRSREATLSCTAPAVACAEVRLVRAGHAQAQTGWRAAGPHIRMVEDAIARATAQEAQCAQAVRPAAAASAVTAPAPSAVPAQAQPVKPQTFTFLADALFRFDRSGLHDILPDGAQRLKELAGKLKGPATVQSIRIEGHTDRLGSAAYNQALSQSRAETVKAFFEAQGTTAASMTAKGMGEQVPVSRDCSDSLPREALIQCLQPDRRVTVEVNGAAP